MRISPRPPGIAAGFESGTSRSCTHSSWAASPLRFSLARAAAASVAIRPTATTISAPRGGRSGPSPAIHCLRSAMGGTLPIAAAREIGPAEGAGSYRSPVAERPTSTRESGRAKTIALHGRTVSYREAGDGPALLLVHGMAGTSEGWDAVIGPLARRHTVIAPDFPGHGDSEPGGG